MRKNILWLLLVGMIAASCGNSKKDQSGSLNDKKAELAKLKKDQAEINKKVTDLETEIAKLDTGAARSQNAKLVGVTALGEQKFIHYIDLQGKVDADNVSYVAPRMGPGLVKAVYVTKGQSVRKGQLLLKLDDAIQRQQVVTARSGLATLEVQLATAKDIYNRRQNLWKQGIGAEAQVIEARTNVAALETQLATARNNVGIAQEQVNATNIVAEVSGVADEVNIRPGEMFTGVAGNAPQIRIVNNGSLKTIVQVPENYAGKVKTGAPVVVVLPDINKTFENVKISRAGELIDPSTRTFSAEARIPFDPAIRPNQIARIRIQDYEASSTIAVPVNTVQSDEKGKFVFVAVREADKLIARRKSVTVGELNGSLIEIKSGLQTGDQLITEGYQNLYEGQVIKTTLK